MQDKFYFGSRIKIDIKDLKNPIDSMTKIAKQNFRILVVFFGKQVTQ